MLRRALISSFLFGCAISQMAMAFLGPIYINPDAINSAPKNKHQLINSLSQEQITQRGHLELGELLKQLPSIVTRSVGGVGTFSQVSIRGSAGNQVAVYLDGILINDAVGGAVDLSRFSLSNIERIDVYKNLSPLNFNQQLAGGAIHLISKGLRPTQQLNMSVGSFNSSEINFSSSGRTNGWAYRLFANKQQSKNDFEILNTNNTSLNPFDDFKEPRHNNGSELVGYGFSTSYIINKNNKLLLSYSNTNKLQELTNRSNDEDNNAEFTAQNNQLKINYLNYLDSQHSAVAETVLNLNSLKQNLSDSNDKIGIDAQNNDYLTKKWSLQQSLNLPITLALGDINLNITASIAEETFKSTYRLLSKAYVPSEERFKRQTNTVGLEVNIPLLDTDFLLTPQLLFNSIRDKDENSNTQSEDHFYNFRLEAVYRLNEEFQVNSFIGDYQRHPSFSEKYADHGLSVGNVDLKSESGETFSLGFTWQPNSSFDELSLDAQIFKKNSNDLIVNSYDSQGIGRYDNVSSAHMTGFEISSHLAQTGNFQIDSNYSYIESQTESSVSAYDGRALPNTPKHQLNVFIDKKLNNNLLSLLYHYQVIQGSFYDRSNLLLSPKQELHNLGLRYDFNSTILSFDMKNVTDQKTEDFNGYPSPGRHYFLNISTKF